MLTRTQIRGIQETTRDIAEPVFSLYLPTGPVVPGNTPRAWELRVKRAIESTGAPGEIGDAVMAQLHAPIHGKTLVFFASRREVHRIDLHVDLPVLDAGSGDVDAAWGAPLLGPLHHAFSALRYGVIQIDRESARICEAFLGEIAELGAVTRETVYELTGDAEPVRQSNPSHVVRGGSVHDHEDRRDGSWRQRFYRDIGRSLTRWVDVRGIDRLLVLGPIEDTASWMSAVNGTLRQRTAPPLGSLPNPRAGTSEVLRAVEPAIRDDEQRQRQQVVDEIAETGVRGAARCGLALERGRLRLVAAGWSIGRDARESLIRAAYERGTRLVFATGAAESKLQASCGGVGGLVRGGER